MSKVGRVWEKYPKNKGSINNDLGMINTPHSTWRIISLLLLKHKI